MSMAWKGWHESCTVRMRKGVCVIFEWKNIVGVIF